MIELCLPCFTKNKGLSEWGYDSSGFLFFLHVILSVLYNSYATNMTTSNSTTHTFMCYCCRCRLYKSPSSIYFKNGLCTHILHQRQHMPFKICLDMGFIDPSKAISITNGPCCCASLAFDFCTLQKT